MVRQNIEKESDELKQVEAFLEVLREQFYYLNVMLFHIVQDGFNAILLVERLPCLILQLNYFVDELLGNGS